MKKALIMVDLQNDFCSNGSLAVPDGDAVIPLANQLQKYFDIVVATKDWHPADHKSFAVNHPDKAVGDVIQLENVSQILWPAHCVQDMFGAEFHPQLLTDRINKVIFKGTHKTIDSYSAFFDNARLCATGLDDYLRKEKVQEVYIIGLATDYCVKFSCLDAAALGFTVYLIEDACRAVELKSGDSQAAIAEMCAVGVKKITSSIILNKNGCLA